MLLHGLVGLPQRGETGGLGGHDVDAVAKVDGQFFDAGAGEFEDFILDKAAREGGFDKRDGDVVRTDAVTRFAGEVDQHDFGALDVVGVFQQLLDELRAAFADAHGT